MNSASAPNLRSSATSFSPSSSRRPEITIREPSFANARAVARPIPVNAPVIKTTRVFITLSLGSRIHSAIHGKIRPGNVRGLRTGYKRHQRSDLINAPVAVECCGGFLGQCPIARSGIQLRVDRTRLHVVDRDTPAPDLSGQTLTKYLHRALRGRVRHKPG